MVGFLQRWNSDGFWKFSPSPLMEWYLLNHWQRWFFNGFSNFEDQWFTMVTRFSQNEILDKMRVNEDLSETKHGMKSKSTQVDINQGTSCSKHCKKIFLIFQKLSLVCLISASARHKGRKFTTIAKNQWFLSWSLPLHWWNGTCSTIGTNGFSVSQPLVKMFFNGCQPLVERCDGNDTSFRSTHRALKTGV